MSARDMAKHEKNVRDGHCGHKPKCLNIGERDERDPLGCCNCGTRLREAAPDLLEIVQRYVDSADECIRGGDSDPADCDCVACDLTRTARAALAKARGQ